jgi:hypothetical protein
MTSITVASGMNSYAHAEMVSSSDAIDAYAAHADRNFLLGEIQRQEIRNKIQSLGVDPVEAEARLAALSDAEVSAIVSRLKDDPAGADAGSSIIGAMVTVFIILLVTDLLCFTKVFNFTRCQIS